MTKKNQRGPRPMIGSIRTEAGVTIYAPVDPRNPKKKFYRIKWVENSKRQDTTATSLDEAERKAVVISRRLMAQSGERDFLPIRDMVDVYLDPTQVAQRKWGENHVKNSTYLLNEFVEEFGDTICNELSAEDLKSFITQNSQKTSVSKAEHMSATLSALINWGEMNDWLTQDCKKLLVQMKAAAKNNKSQSRKSGESVKFVNRKLIPSHQQVDALAKKLATKFEDPTWELFVNLAAYAGLRIGEQLDLDIDSVDTKERVIKVETQCLDTGKRMSRSAPKWDTERETTYPEVTPMGYPLAKKLEAHIKKVKAQKVVPTLQDGTKRKLLFPDSNGGWMRKTNYSKRYRVPAQADLGWARKANGRFIWNHHSLRHVFCTYYLAQTNNNFQAVAIAAGHKSFQTTIEMYIGVTDQAMSALKDAGKAPQKAKKSTIPAKKGATGQKTTTRNSSKGSTKSVGKTRKA